MRWLRPRFPLDPGITRRDLLTVKWAHETAYFTVVPASFDARRSLREHDAHEWMAPAAAFERLPYAGVRTALRMAMARVPQVFARAPGTYWLSLRAATTKSFGRNRRATSIEPKVLGGNPRATSIGAKSFGRNRRATSIGAKSFGRKSTRDIYLGQKFWAEKLTRDIIWGQKFCDDFVSRYHRRPGCFRCPAACSA